MHIGLDKYSKSHILPKPQYENQRGIRETIIMKNRIFALTALIFFCAGPLSAATLTLTGTIRDLSDAHPDVEMGFLGNESMFGLDLGIVEATLGADGTPVYAGGTIGSTTNAANFFDWFHDTANNLSTQFSIELNDDMEAGVLAFWDDEFFPIDDQLLGNEGRIHNYHLTYHVTSSFTYLGGEFFEFFGDDDVWLFIDDSLVLDIGGIHGALNDNIDLDTLGLNINQNYSFDFFFAERHTDSSIFHIETNIQLMSDPIPEPMTISMLLAGLLGFRGFSRRKKLS